MGLFTIDRTINFEENKVKKLLEIINNSNNDNEIEDNMVSNNIVSLRENTSPHGFFRRRWVTFLKEFGLYDGEKLSEIGLMYLQNYLTTKEVILLNLVNRVSKIQDEKIIRPLELIIYISKNLYNQKLNSYIEEDEFKYISRNIIDNTEEEILNMIIKKRVNNGQFDIGLDDAPVHYDIWKNLLKTAGLSNNQDKIDIDFSLPIIDYIIEYYQNNKPIEGNEFRFKDNFTDSILLPKKKDEENQILFKRKNYENNYSKIIYEYLFVKSINSIERETLGANENGNIPFDILNGFNISTSRYDNPSNMRLYSSFVGYEGIVVNRLRKTNDTIYSFIASNIKSYVDDNFDIEEKDKNMENDKLREFYIKNLENNEHIEKEIANRNKFLNEYPIERILSLTKEEYCLGFDKNSLCYQIEFGDYGATGFGIGNGTSGKYGLYYSKKYASFRDKKNELVDNPDEYWEALRKQLYDFLVEMKDNEPNFKLEEKYPMLGGSGNYMVLTKLLSLYYPNKYVSMSKDDIYKKLGAYYDVTFNEDAIKNSYKANIVFREKVPEANQNDGFYIANAIWKFFKEGPQEDFEEKSTDVIEEYSKDEFLKEVFMSERKYNAIISLLDRKKNIILQGAPGVGKTFIAKRLAYSIIGGEDKSKVELIQFHQSYSYEDFIEGFRPTENSFELKKGIFYKFCEKARNNPDSDYYLIIDEINRGNLSKIFGELLMLIESDKRGDELRLEYSEELFSVPSNLYLIGLMNTADRSLALIDYALRRRFSFVTIEPAFNNKEDKNGECYNKFMTKYHSIFGQNNDNVIELIKELNNDIQGDPALGEGFMIGHSYFCPNKENGSKKDINEILEYEIKPLIEEYWYDDEEQKDKWMKKIDALILEE